MSRTGPSLTAGQLRAGPGKAGQRVRNGSVIAQLALASVLVIGACLMVRSYRAMSRVSPGFSHPSTVQTAMIDLDLGEAATPVETVETHERMLRRIQAIPGASAAGFASSVAMDGRGRDQRFEVEGFPVVVSESAPFRRAKFVSPGYFEAMGNPVIAGRPLSWTDIRGRANVVVVTENFATQYWTAPAEAIGKRIREREGQPWREIIGVVGDVLGIRNWARTEDWSYCGSGRGRGSWSRIRGSGPGSRVATHGACA